MVIIVLGYVWQTGTRQDAKDDHRDKAFIAAMASRDREWRDFMNIERTRQADGLANLTRELSTLVLLSQATNSLITQHDTWERQEIERRLPMKPATGPLTPKT